MHFNPHYIALHYIALHLIKSYNILHYKMLLHIILHYVTLYYIMLYYTASNYITLHFIMTLHFILVNPISFLLPKCAPVHCTTPLCSTSMQSIAFLIQQCCFYNSNQQFSKSIKIPYSPCTAMDRLHCDPMNPLRTNYFCLPESTTAKFNSFHTSDILRINPMLFFSLCNVVYCQVPRPSLG